MNFWDKSASVGFRASVIIMNHPNPRDPWGHYYYAVRDKDEMFKVGVETEMYGHKVKLTRRDDSTTMHRCTLYFEVV